MTAKGKVALLSPLCGKVGRTLGLFLCPNTHTLAYPLFFSTRLREMSSFMISFVPP